MRAHVTGSRVLPLTLVLAVSGCRPAPAPPAEAAATAASAQAGPRREVIAPEGVPGLRFFSPAVRTGNLIFLSGAIGARPGTLELVEGGTGPETTVAMEHLRTVLQSVGADMDDVLKCTVFIADIADYDAMNEAYAEFFPSDPPARSTVAVSALALGANVEVECIAVAPEDS
jgi:2-iminobutanoate/2-iminopropanoate deaminase